VVLIKVRKMETLFITKTAQFKQKDNTVYFQTGGKKRTLPINRIAHIVLLSESTLTTKLLAICSKNQVRISFFDHYGYFKGAFEPSPESPSGKVKLAQASFVLDEPNRLSLAKEILFGAFHNMEANLKYYAFRGKTELRIVIENLKKISFKLLSASNIPSIMGFEGNYHQIYFNAWSKIDTQLDFGKRIRRPPNNPINCLISFFNQLTYTVVRHELAKTHLDETFSFLHSPSSGRSSLSLDLAEIFKPILSDGLIFRLVRKGILDSSWFEEHDSVCLLSETGRRNATQQFSIRIEEKIESRSYREWIYRQALAIEKHVLEVEEYQSFKRRV